MTRTNRALPIVLIAVVLLSVVLGGCGQAQNTETSGTTAQSTTAVTTAGEPTEKVYTKAETTLTWYNDQGTATGWLEDFIVKNTGIHIEYIGTDTDRMQAMLASGGFSDIDLVTFPGWQDFETASKGNMLVSLDEHLDSIPNAVENCATAMQFMRDEHSQGTGKLYGFPNTIGEYTLTTNTGSYAANTRWDIYSAIGAPPVKTLEDFLPVLKKMQDYYPKTPDGQKVYAISFFSEWDGTSFMYNTASFFTLSGYFEGLGSSFLEWNLRTNKASEILDPNSLYMRALKFYFNANQLGILDPDSLTQTYDSARAKVDAGAVLTAWNWYDGSSFNTDENVNAETPIGFQPIMFDEYCASVAGNYPVGWSNPIGISAQTENLDACLRFMDFWSKYDTYLTYYNGPQGDLWDINKDGKLYATEKYLANIKSIDTLELTGGGKLKEKPNVRKIFRETAVHPGYGYVYDMNYWPDVLAATKRTKLNDAWTKVYGADWPLDKIKAENRIIYRPLASTLLGPAPADIKTLRNQISEMVVTNSYRMVFAKNEAEFNSIYNETVTQAEGLGIDKVTAFMQDNLAKALEKASKYQK